MSLFNLISGLIASNNTHDLQLDKARKRHDRLPKSKYDKLYLVAKQDLKQAQSVAKERYYQLGKILRAIVDERYSPIEHPIVSKIMALAIDRLATKVRIFPDIEYDNIWYTDYYDIIELAKYMGFGDERLPHWHQESNSFNRYLELTTSDLVQILLSFSEEALLDAYQPGVNVDKWLQYIFREALKTQMRMYRERQRQYGALRISYKP